MVARIAGFEAAARNVGPVFVRVVMRERESGRRAVVMLVAVRGRSVLMLGVIVPAAVRMHMRRRNRGGRDRDDQRKQEGQ